MTSARCRLGRMGVVRGLTRWHLLPPLDADEPRGEAWFWHPDHRVGQCQGQCSLSDDFRQRGRGGTPASATRETGHRRVSLRGRDHDGNRRGKYGPRTRYRGTPGGSARESRAPRWDAIAERCVSRRNCTMVCPTCFCTTVTNTSSLVQTAATRTRLWGSCFTTGHSEIGGVPYRRSIRSRYRQWATHRLATGREQFGTAGCVGCGTWCPVGIDLTEEVAAIR